MPDRPRSATESLHPARAPELSSSYPEVSATLSRSIPSRVETHRRGLSERLADVTISASSDNLSARLQSNVSPDAHQPTEPQNPSVPHQLDPSAASDTSSDWHEDPFGIRHLQRDFDALIASISARVTDLCDETVRSVAAGLVITQEEAVGSADAAIERAQAQLAECDYIENEFMKIESLAHIVSEFGARMDDIERQLRHRESRKR